MLGPFGQRRLAQRRRVAAYGEHEALVHAQRLARVHGGLAAAQAPQRHALERRPRAYELEDDVARVLLQLGADRMLSLYVFC